ncbi:hypothetical protein Hsero_1290 [Herbaspirillum seropedicae SmR1]|uniref:Uncharacterized protein n=1 Tax=Herbaspirillum seropedicae (strain SmR1) TaxID=757424 RepID=D8INY6_HERSS|nr:hypothetical protein Hsero_1290 [Herbaspirillum seropedicae SmR1]
MAGQFSSCSPAGLAQESMLAINRPDAGSTPSYGDGGLLMVYCSQLFWLH